MKRGRQGDVLVSPDGRGVNARLLADGFGGHFEELSEHTRDKRNLPCCLCVVAAELLD